MGAVIGGMMVAAVLVSSLEYIFKKNRENQGDDYYRRQGGPGQRDGIVYC